MDIELVAPVEVDVLPSHGGDVLEDLMAEMDALIEEKARDRKAGYYQAFLSPGTEERS